MEGNQFDTIYHEHFSYFSFGTARRIFARHGLVLFDVEELPTHGARCGSGAATATERRGERAGGRLRPSRLAAGLETPAPYAGFGQRVVETKRKLLEFLIAAKRQGASDRRLRRPRQGQHPAELLRDPHRLPRLHRRPQPLQARPLHPGTHIPIFPPERLAETRPDYILILPWNLKDEIIEQLAYTREWGALRRPHPRGDGVRDDLARQGGPR